MIITISGNPGSGKSTIAKYVTEKLNLKRIYVGDIRRKIALNKGITLEELNKISLNNPDYDVKIDNDVKKQVIELAKENNVIVEGRIQFYFFPQSLKFYFYCDPKIAAERIWNDIQQGKRESEKFQSYEQVLKSINDRELNDAERYIKYYNIDPRDQNNYDIIIDTTNLNVEQVLKMSLEKIQNYLDEETKK